MRIADSLLNKAEEVAFRELEAIANDNALRAVSTGLESVFRREHEV